MPQQWLHHLAKISIGTAIALLLLVGVSVFAQTSDIENSAPSSAIGSIQPVTRSESDNLLATTPQLLDIEGDILLGPFVIDPPIGLCEVELDRLPDLPATNADLLSQMSIPDELVLWRLIPDPLDAPDEAWQENPYVYNPRTESIIFQCFDRATYTLFRGTPTAAYNMGLSDSGSLPFVLNLHQQIMLLLSGLFLVIGGSAALFSKRVSA